MAFDGSSRSERFAQQKRDRELQGKGHSVDQSCSRTTDELFYRPNDQYYPGQDEPVIRVAVAKTAKDWKIVSSRQTERRAKIEREQREFDEVDYHDDDDDRWDHTLRSDHGREEHHERRERDDELRNDRIRSAKTRGRQEFVDFQLERVALPRNFIQEAAMHNKRLGLPAVEAVLAANDFGMNSTKRVAWFDLPLVKVDGVPYLCQLMRERYRQQDLISRTIMDYRAPIGMWSNEYLSNVLGKGFEEGRPCSMPVFAVPFPTDWVVMMDAFFDQGKTLTIRGVLQMRLIQHSWRGINFGTVGEFTAARFDLSRLWFRTVFNMVMHMDSNYLKMAVTMLRNLDAAWDQICIKLRPSIAIATKNGLIGEGYSPDVIGEWYDQLVEVKFYASAVQQARWETDEDGEDEEIDWERNFGFSYGHLRSNGGYGVFFNSVAGGATNNADRWDIVWRVVNTYRPPGWSKVVTPFTPVPKMSWLDFARDPALSNQGTTVRSSVPHMFRGTNAQFRKGVAYAALDNFLEAIADAI